MATNGTEDEVMADAVAGAGVNGAESDDVVSEPQRIRVVCWSQPKKCADEK